MPKPITAATVKTSFTHDRLALTIKYVNGEVLKISSTRCAERLKTERPVGSQPLAANTLRNILSFVEKHASPTETNGQRYERLAKFFEGTKSIADAAALAV